MLVFKTLLSSYIQYIFFFPRSPLTKDIWRNNGNSLAFGETKFNSGVQNFPFKLSLVLNCGALQLSFLCIGLVDLRAGTIATPLPAKTTFLDDPLRVLRAIRFGM